MRKLILTSLTWQTTNYFASPKHTENRIVVIDTPKHSTVEDDRKYATDVVNEWWKKSVYTKDNTLLAIVPHETIMEGTGIKQSDSPESGLTKTEIVLRLIGPVRPVGDSSIDSDRYKNLKELCLLVDDLVSEISLIAKGIESTEHSVAVAGSYAHQFIQGLDEYIEDSETPSHERAKKQRFVALKNALNTIDQFATPSLDPETFEGYEKAKNDLLNIYERSNQA